VRGPAIAFHAVVGVMKKGSSVVLIGLIADIARIPHYGTYATTKAACVPTRAPGSRNWRNAASV